MNLLIIILFLGLPALFFLACSKSGSIKDTGSKNKNNIISANSELSKYDLNSENPNVIRLPGELKEVSGMTVTPDGRLFANQDESGVIYQINSDNGEIIKKFSLGYIPVKGDFEDLTYVNNKFYLLSSNGDIYEFSEGENNGSVEYKVYKTELKRHNDVEGMCYDPDTNSLLLACKGSSGTDESDKAVYAFSLDKMSLDDKPRFMLPLSEIKKTFNPSGIQSNPKTGTFFIIAASGNEIIEISREGNIIGNSNLLPSVHIQPEGIVFGKDNSLYISNEGKDGEGYIVIYPYKN